jgi:hypothetical protein
LGYWIIENLLYELFRKFYHHFEITSFASGYFMPLSFIFAKSLNLASIFFNKIKNIIIMYTTYHLTSAQEVNSDILDAIKAAFKSKPITIIVEEDTNGFDLSSDLKAVLDERLLEDEDSYLTSDESINQIKQKYGL